MGLTFLKDHKSQLYLSGVLFLAVLIFSKTLFFEFVWDDNVLLVGQESYQSATLGQLALNSINGIEYLPLRDLTYIFDYQLWGWNPVGFHLTNLILYILNILAIFWFTLVLNSSLFQTNYNNKAFESTWVALITVAIFSVLPVHSEVVSFIHCRNVLLSGLFFFLSCTCFLKFTETNLRRYIFASSTFFTFALLSKATVIMLPLILMTFLYFKPVRQPRNYVSILPFILLAVFFYFVFKNQATESNAIFEDHAIVFGSYDFFSKLGTALQIPIFYVAKLLLPIGLSTEYKIEFSRSLFSLASLLSFLFLCLCFGISYYFRKEFPQLLFSLAWFLICLVPVLNFFLTNPVVADRYVYLSSFSYAYFLALLIFRFGATNGVFRLLILLVPILGIYSWLSFERNDVWRSQVTVMEDMIKSSPNNVKGYVSLGYYYFEKGQFSKAFKYFQDAKEISPAFSELEYYQARLAYMQNKPNEALELLETTLRFDGSNTQAWVLSGKIHESQGNLMLAVHCFQKSLDSGQVSPLLKEYAKSKLQDVKDKLELSLTAIMRDIKAHPADLNKKAEFAVTLQSAGFRKKAISQYQDLLRQVGPKWEIYYNLGLLYRDEKQFDRSLINYQLSLSLNEKSGMIHNELGVLYKRSGQYEEAMNHFKQAIELDPSSVKPLVNLARLHFQLGNKKTAKVLFNQVITNFPDYEILARDYISRITP